MFGAESAEAQIYWRREASISRDSDCQWSVTHNAIESFASVEFFYHTGIRAVLAAIWGKWFPGSGHKAVNAPMLERYGEEFDPTTGLGGFEIWIPIEG